MDFKPDVYVPSSEWHILSSRGSAMRKCYAGLDINLQRSCYGSGSSSCWIKCSAVPKVIRCVGQLSFLIRIIHLPSDMSEDVDGLPKSGSAPCGRCDEEAWSACSVLLVVGTGILPITGTSGRVTFRRDGACGPQQTRRNGWKTVLKR